MLLSLSFAVLLFSGAVRSADDFDSDDLAAMLAGAPPATLAEKTKQTEAAQKAKIVSATKGAKKAAKKEGEATKAKLAAGQKKKEEKAKDKTVPRSDNIKCAAKKVENLEKKLADAKQKKDKPLIKELEKRLKTARVALAQVSNSGKSRTLPSICASFIIIIAAYYRYLY